VSEPVLERPRSAAHPGERARLATLGAPLIGIFVGLLIGAFLILLAGADPIAAYAVMFKGAFGGQRQIEETLLKAAPLLIVALGLTVAFRARVWNIGGEGQFFIGALFGSVFALGFPGWPRPLLIAAMLVAAAVGGMLWALLAGVLKTKRGISEIISTLMLNYIAALFVLYMARGPLQDPKGYLPETAQFAAAARMPALFGTRIHIGVLLAVLLVPLVYVLIWMTPLGFRLRAVGSRASVARSAGIRVERTILFALAFSGALAGIAGIIEVSYLHTRLKGTISGGYGFSAILVALLGRMHPVGVAVAALFFAALTIGAQSMHVVYALPDSLANVIQAVIVLCVLAADAIARRRRG
jgi:general nucleoside transport system permease protein